MIAIYVIDGSLRILHNRALFTSPLNVNKPTEVQLHGIRKQAMQAIIDFAYTRSTEITDANVTEIIVVAHYFGMPRLEHICTNFIKNMLTPENVILLWLELRLIITRMLAEDLKIRA